MVQFFYITLGAGADAGVEPGAISQQVPSSSSLRAAPQVVSSKTQAVASCMFSVALVAAAGACAQSRSLHPTQSHQAGDRQGVKLFSLKG